MQTNEQVKPQWKQDQTASRARRRMGLAIPSKQPGTRYRYHKGGRGYAVTETGAVACVEGRKPWRNKSERRQVLKQRRIEREALKVL